MVAVGDDVAVIEDAERADASLGPPGGSTDRTLRRVETPRGRAYANRVSTAVRALGRFVGVQPQPQRSPTVHHRVRARPASTATHFRGPPRTFRRRSVLPDTSRLTNHRRARRAQLPMPDRPGQARNRR